MTVTEPCVSPTTGTLGPDLRVNYAYGMVLGLDEFLQEQLHRLTKNALHERGQHGFGTVSGLAVSVTPAGATDYTVNVTTGVAVDQWGREIVIRCDQCARIGAWLGVQEQSEPGTLARRQDQDGKVTVYVVASYAECLDALVPLPGQPCSSSDNTMVPSRIRDAWDVELRWEPPEMPRWDTDRRLARLLGSVEFVAGLPEASSSEADILVAVLDLADRADDGPADLDPPTGSSWQLPLETAAAALDRLFTAWVTRVRPGLAPDLIDPDVASDPAILLASITFQPVVPFDPSAPALQSCDDPVDDGRPFLLHTQLIQELRFLGERGEVVSPEESTSPPVSLVTLFATGGPSRREPTRIDAWFQLEKPVHLPETINVTDEDGGDSEFLTSAVDDQGNPTDFAFVWTLTAKEPGMHSRPGLQLRALFPATSVQVADPGTTLLDYEDSTDVPFLDQDATGDVTAYAVVHGPAAQAKVVAKASKEFVEITTLRNNGEVLFLEYWFHLQPVERVDNVRMVKFDLHIFDELTGAQLPILAVTQSSVSPNLWFLQVRHPDIRKNLPVLLRHMFPTNAAAVVDPDGNEMPLDEWIHRADITYVGWDETRAEVIAFSRSANFQELDESDVHRLYEEGERFPPPDFKEPERGPIRTGPFAFREIDSGVVPVMGVAKKTPAKKTPAKKAPAKRTVAKKTPAKKAPAKKGGGNQ